MAEPNSDSIITPESLNNDSTPGSPPTPASLNFTAESLREGLAIFRQKTEKETIETVFAMIDNLDIQSAFNLTSHRFFHTAESSEISLMEMVYLTSGFLVFLRVTDGLHEHVTDYKLSEYRENKYFTDKGFQIFLIHNIGTIIDYFDAFIKLRGLKAFAHKRIHGQNNGFRDIITYNRVVLGFYHPDRKETAKVPENENKSIISKAKDAILSIGKNKSKK
jgi:hypothetical protein